MSFKIQRPILSKFETVGEIKTLDELTAAGCDVETLVRRGAITPLSGPLADLRSTVETVESLRADMLAAQSLAEELSVENDRLREENKRLRKANDESTAAIAESVSKLDSLTV